MPDERDNPIADEIFAVTQELLADAEEVTSTQLAERTGHHDIDVQAALKHLWEADRITASFHIDEPAVVTEVGS